MNLAQIKMYRAEWAKAAKVLSAAGRTAEEIEAKRLAITAQVCGRAKSSTKFTGRELDRVIAAIKAISAPADFNAQMRQEDQPDVRREAAMAAAVAACQRLHGLDSEHYQLGTEAARRAYIAGVAKRLGVYGIDTCDAAALRRVAGELEQHAARVERRMQQVPVADETEPF